METIHAVVWVMFVPLSLKYDSAEEAIEAAKAMHEKASSNGVVIHDLRAVTLDGENKLHTLWKP